MLVPARASVRPRVASSLLLGGLAALVVSVPAAVMVMAQEPAPPAGAPCAVGLDVGSLSARDRGFVARHVLACGDLERGAISRHEYRARITAIDTAWTALPLTPPVMQWASTVREVSTQYTAASWAATKVLGAPDVYPTHGDNAAAWASLGADDRAEWIEVGYDQPMPVSAVDIYETYNPGAVDRVELITVSGERIEAYAGKASARGAAARIQHVETGCTQEPIVAVRVHLDSAAVPGWNELDAIGLLPCTP